MGKGVRSEGRLFLALKIESVDMDLPAVER